MAEMERKDEEGQTSQAMLNLRQHLSTYISRDNVKNMLQTKDQIPNGADRITDVCSRTFPSKPEIPHN